MAQGSAGGNPGTREAGNLVAGLSGLKSAFPPVGGAALALPTKDFHFWELKTGVHSAENHIRGGKPLLLGGQTAYPVGFGGRIALGLDQPKVGAGLPTAVHGRPPLPAPA